MYETKVKPEIEIPYFDHSGNFIETVQNSSRRRGLNPLGFLIRKFINIFLVRISYFFPLNSFRIKCHRWRGVNIGKNVYIGAQCTIDNAYPEFVYIEDNVSLAGECLIITHSNPYSHFQFAVPARVAPVVIKAGAWLCVRSVVLPGVTIGENSIISAGAVVDSDVPPRCVVSGNPAVIVARNIPIA